VNREEVLKIAKPILFNTEMVKAILEGRKTATRRVIPEKMVDEYYDYDDFCISVGTGDISTTREYEEEFFSKRAKWQVGDILYVRETWTQLCRVDENGYTHFDDVMTYYYADGEPDINLYDADGFLLDDQTIKWKPSIHMPKEAARILLKVTDVRVERLQDMCVADCVREGVEVGNAWTVNAKPNFIKLWDSTIKKQDIEIYGWKANPWVWVIEFERIEVEQ